MHFQVFRGAQLARFLGMTTSAVVRTANSEDLLEIDSYS